MTSVPPPRFHAVKYAGVRRSRVAPGYEPVASESAAPTDEDMRSGDIRIETPVRRSVFPVGARRHVESSSPHAGRRHAHDRIDKVRDVVRATLEEAGRKDHGACGRAASAQATLVAPVAVPAPTKTSTPRPAPRLRLVFDGARDKGVSFVHVNGKPFSLQNLRFATLLAFAAAQERNWEKYWGREELGFDGNTDHPSRITTTLKPALPEGFELFKRAQATYQLNPEVEVEIAWASYEDHANEEVRAVVAKHLARVKAQQGVG